MRRQRCQMMAMLGQKFECMRMHIGAIAFCVYAFADNPYTLATMTNRARMRGLWAGLSVPCDGVLLYQNYVCLYLPCAGARLVHGH
jgi:hypothetical protein